MFKYLYRKTLRPVAQLTYNRMIKPIFEIKDSAHSIALGVAVGLWIAFTPTVGIQMTLSVIACTILRANILVAVAMCWVSNPITFVPMYYSYYKLGLVVTDAKSISGAEFKKSIQNNYVLVSKKKPRTQDTAQSLKSIEHVPVFYSANFPVTLGRFNVWQQNHGINPNSKNSLQVTGDFQAVMEKIVAEGGYGITDWISFNRWNNTQTAKLHIVTEIPPDRDLWNNFKAVFFLAFQEIGIPMWIGSLIIATVVAFPAYPITYRAINRFRERIRDSNKIAKLRDKTRQIRQRVRMKDKTSNETESPPG